MENNFGGLTDGKNKWNYLNNGWKTAGPNDVNIQCLLEGKLYTYNILELTYSFYLSNDLKP